MSLIGVYAVKNKNEETRLRSRSGGIFSALSDWVLEQGGSVYGCVLDDDLQPIHIKAETKDQRDRMRGSKYVQSNMLDSYRNAKADLQEGKQVLFSGTACQIAGLKGFLGKTYDNLYCVDIVCHGVPSVKLYKAYIQWIENRTGRRITNIDFRNKKKFGWKAHVETLKFENGREMDVEVYRNIFLSCNALRPSCYSCLYKNLDRVGDISIADYWGIEKAAPEFDDDMGVSLVLVNSKNGERLFDSIKHLLKYKQTDIKDSMQAAISENFPMPGERNEFWENFIEKGFDYIARKYGKYNWNTRFVGYIKRIIKSFIHTLK